MNETERNRQIRNTTGASRVAGLLGVLFTIMAVGLASWTTAAGAALWFVASAAYAYRASTLITDGSRD